jgi:glycerol-3-phosphate dehydrogenase
MGLRSRNIEQQESEEFDVLTIGGRINSVVSAAALIVRGVRVALIDARDFAVFTSQQSSDLVRGGIKYIESYEFGLGAGLCKSHNELLGSFPRRHSKTEQLFSKHQLIRSKGLFEACEKLFGVDA